MRRTCVWLILVALLAGCGSGSDDSTGSATATTSGEGAATTAESAATRTPDNAVQTAEAAALNTSFATALPIDGEVRTTINESTFYYSLQVPAGGVVSATLAVESGSPSPAQLQLYDKNQRAVNNTQVAVGDSAGLSYIFAEAGTVFLEIRGNSSIVLNASAAPQNDAGSKQDAPDDSDFSKALLIKDGAVSGILGGADSIDLYAVDIPKGGARWTLDVAMAGSSDITLDTFNREQNYASNAAALATEPISITELIPVQSSGRWYVRVRGNGAYSFTSTITAQNDAALKADAPDDNDFAKAAKIELGTFKAELGDNDDTDLFAFELPKTGMVMTITLQAASDVTLNTFNSEQNYMDEGNSVADAPVTLTHVLPVGSGGRWYARFRGTGSYSFSITTSPQQDGGVAGDAPEEFNKAILVSAASFTGQLGNEDNYDMLRIPASMGRNVTVTVLSGDDAVDVQLFTATENYGGDGTATTAAPATLIEDSAEGGDYIIRLQSNAQVTYRVEISQ